MATKPLYVITAKTPSWQSGYTLVEHWIYDDLAEAQDLTEDWTRLGSTEEYVIFKLEEVQ